MIKAFSSVRLLTVSQEFGVDSTERKRNYFYSDTINIFNVERYNFEDGQPKILEKLNCTGINGLPFECISEKANRGS